MALDLEHFNADPWDLNDIVPNDIEVICFHHFLPFFELYFSDLFFNQTREKNTMCNNHNTCSFTQGLLIFIRRHIYMMSSQFLTNLPPSLITLLMYWKSPQISIFVTPSWKIFQWKLTENWSLTLFENSNYWQNSNLAIMNFSRFKKGY